MGLTKVHGVNEEDEVMLFLVMLIWKRAVPGKSTDLFFQVCALELVTA